MSEFWALGAPSSRIALVSAAPGDALPAQISYGQLKELADAFATELPPAGTLGFILAGNDAPSVIAYLGALRQQRACCLLPAELGVEQLQSLLECYRPEWVLSTQPALPDPAYQATAWHGRWLYRRTEASDAPVHPDLALLLSTSGSTGSPKLVRLSRAAIAANAASIAQYLALDEHERAITTLPLSYSYGLSILNSHLHVGARVLLSADSVLARPFWDFFRQEGASSLAGVPYTWQMLARLRLDTLGLNTLRTLTQAGGALAEPLKSKLREMAAAQGWRFFVMYGQTEACARIAYLPPEQTGHSPGCIGVAIPGGALEIDPQTEELVYRGPNVMMGYANERDDLAAGDLLKGCLRTGDLASQDEAGLFYLKGRLKRIAKVFGNRINLDEVEALVERQFPGSQCAALDAQDSLLLACSGDISNEACLQYLRSALGLHPSGLKLYTHSIPLTASGKKDYARLQRELLS